VGLKGLFPISSQLSCIHLQSHHSGIERIQSIMLILASANLQSHHSGIESEITCSAPL